MGQKRLPFILMVLIAADLWHFNMYKSPLVNASITFDELYGKRQQAFEDRIRPVKEQAKQQPLYRLWMSNPSIAIGPLDGSLAARTEATWGAGLLELNRYAEYARAVASNPRLLHGLSANYLLDTRGRLEVNPSALPRVSVPGRSPQAATRNWLRWTPPRDPWSKAHQERDPAAARGAHGHRLSRGLLSDPVFRRGRHAHPHRGSVGARMARCRGRNARRPLPVDYALSGVMVPAGQHQLTLQFRPNTFLIGAGLSVAAMIGMRSPVLYGEMKHASPRGRF